MQDAIRHDTARVVRRQPLLSLGGSLLLALLTVNAAWAGPEGGVIRRGEGNITRPNATTTNINQHTQRMVVDWQSFNVAANEQVNFHQPNSSASALNRIYDQNPSQVFGQINANGRILLVNANGIYFGENAAVNVGSLIASGLDIDVDSFMNGQLHFDSELLSPGTVINRGLIHAADGGHVGLIGGAVENSGVIIANHGSIELAAGRMATVDFDGDGLIRFAVSEEVLENVSGLDSAVNNSGTLQADGGVIAMTGRAAQEIFNQVVNNSGVIAANSITSDGGRIFLSGGSGDTINTGDLDASSANGKGGQIELTGNRVGVGGNATIDASGATGGGTVLIGGDFQGSGETQTAEYTSVTSGVTIDVSAKENGDAGTAIVWSDDTTRFQGDVIARGGEVSGDGGFVEISGKQVLVFNGDVDTRAANGNIGTLLLDPTDIQIVVGSADSSGQNDDVDDGQILFIDPLPSTVVITDGKLTSLNSNITLQADNSITTATGVNVTLGSNRDLTMQTTSGVINLTGSSFTLSGNGAVDIQAGGNLTVGALTVGSGSTSISATGNITMTDAITTNGNVTIQSYLFGASVNDNGGAGSIVQQNTSSTFQVITNNGALSLTNGSNQIHDAAVLVALDSALTTSTAINIGVGAVFAVGVGTDFTLTAGGDVTQTGAAQVGGVLSINAGTTGDITLDNVNNTFASLTLKGADATVVENTGFTVGDIDVANLDIQTSSSGIGQAGGTSVKVSNTLTASTPTTLSWGSTSNDFNVVELAATSAFLGDANTISLGDSTVDNLDVTARDVVISGVVGVGNLTSVRLSAGGPAGAITTSGAGRITGDGALRIRADVAGSDVTLSGANALASIATHGASQKLGTVAVNDAGGITLGDGADGFTAARLELTTTGDVGEGGATGGVIDEAVFGVGGGSSVTLNGGIFDFDTVAMTSGQNLSLVDTDGLALGEALNGVDITGNLAVTASTGNITDGGQVLVDGTSAFTFSAASGQSLVLDSTDNNLAGAISIAHTSLDNVTIDNDSAIGLGALNLTGALDLTAGGDITQAGAWVVAGTTALDAGANDITANNALNQFTTLEFNGATVEIRDSAGGLVLSGGNATTSATVTTVSSLGQTGALTIANGDFRVQGGGTVFLNDGGNDFDQVSVRGWTPLGFTNAGQIIVRDADGLQLDNMSTSSLLTVRAAGHVTQGAGTTISAGVSTSLIDATGFNVTLNNATNDFNVFRANAANVTVQDTDGISLSQSTVTDSMTVTAGGAINQSTAGSAAISITNSLTVDSGAFDVSLQHAGNDIGALAIVDARHVSLVDQGSLALGDASNGVSMTGNLDIEAGLGTLTQADVVSVDGATTINVGGANTNVTLDDAGNHFGGTVTFSNTAGGSFHDIALADDGDLHVSGFGASGDVDFTAKGALTQAAAWAVAGDMSATARDGATTFGITLDSTNAFNAITLDGSNVSVTEGDGFAFSVAGSTVTGTMSVTSSGSVTDNGALTVGGVATFTLGATSDLILDGANVDFQDAVNVTAGRDVTIADATDDLSIGAITVTGAVDLDASGAILDGSLAEGAGAENIVANTIDLTAVDGIGTAGDRLDTDAQSAVPGVSLSVGVTGTGGVYLNETGVANVGGTVNDGDFDYLSNGNIFIASITADATDDTVTLTTTNGNIDDMNDDADLDVQAFDIVLDAGTGNIGGNALAGAGTDPEGLIELDGNTTLTGNNIAVADVAVGAGDRVLDVTASGSFAYSYGSDIYIDLITAGGDLTLISTGGSIYDQQDDTTADIVLTDATRSVTLTADANIGGRSQGNPAPGNARIEIQDAATISADANGGNVLLHSADAVTLDDVEATGNIDITVNGNTEIDSVVAVGDVTLNVAGAITDTNATASNIGGQDVTLTATGAIGSATNRIGTSADTLDVSVETNPGGIFINETNGVTLTDIDTVNGVIDIEAGGAMTVTDVRSIGALEANDVTLQGTAMTVHDIQTAGAGDVFLTATTGAIIDGNGATNNISTDLLTATAQNGISLDTNVTGIALNVTGAGNIDIDENNNLSATASTANGSITITAAGVMAANTVSAGGSADNDDVSLTATSIGVGAVSAAGAGDVTLSATAGAIADTNGATTNVSGDTLIVSAATGINLDTQINAGQFTGGGAGDLDISEANDFTLSTASVVNGKITIASGGETTLQTDLATSGRDIVLVGDVVLAGNRSISTGAGAGSVRVDDINGNGNDLVLNAGTGDVISSGMQNVGKLEVTAENWNTHGAMSVASHDFSGLDGNNWIMDGDTALTISTGNLDLSGFGSIRAASNGSAGLELEAVSGNISATDVDVGNGGSLKHLSMTGRELSLGRVTTSGDQDYKGEATIGSTLSSTGGSILFDGRLELASNAGVSAGKDVVFGNVVDGARDLAITAGGSVRFSDAVGSTTALRNLSITADAVTVHAVRTSGSQEYHAAATVQGNLEARGITFGKSVSFPGGALLVGDTLNFNGGNSSVTGGGELTLVPLTDNASIDLGGGGANLNLNTAALDGYNAGLVIGGIVTTTSITPIASTIDINGNIDVGSGYLKLISKEGIVINSAQVIGDQIVLVASNANGTITNESSDSLLSGREIILVAGGDIGAEGREINVSGLDGSSVLQIASGGSKASVNSVGGSIREEAGVGALIANALADLVGITTNSDLQVVSSSESSANREQSSGLTDEGFIDASLFEEISLFETAGTGILLPLDQSEETPEEGCEVDANGSTRCEMPAVSDGGGVPIAPR